MPVVEFIEPGEEGFKNFIVYVENSNTVMVSKVDPAYVRDVARWAVKTGHPVTVVELAVQQAYGVELAAVVIDVNGQDKYGLAPEFIELLKSPEALYAKRLGVQSLERMIEENLRNAMAGI